MPAPLSPEVFTLLAGLVEARAGLSYRLADKDLVADRVATRAEQAGFASMLDYYYFLRYDPRGSEELDALVEALAVGETYFFRERDQLVFVVDRVVAPAVRDGRRPRVWCAACSTGEEPLSLAMLLSDRGLLDRVELVASDVSRRALAAPRRGVYSGRSLRALGEALPRGLVADPEPPGERRAFARSARVDRALVGAIDWRRVNLLDDDAVAGLGAFDAILCRNVLIYFRDDVTARVVERLARALVRGGLLLVGASESLLRFGADLACEEQHGVFVYRRAS
jgi:chemotaxis protein methyltransferase CheR